MIQLSIVSSNSLNAFRHSKHPPFDILCRFAMSSELETVFVFIFKETKRYLKKGESGESRWDLFFPGDNKNRRVTRPNIGITYSHLITL